MKANWSQFPGRVSNRKAGPAVWMLVGLAYAGAALSAPGEAFPPPIQPGQSTAEWTEEWIKIEPAMIGGMNANGIYLIENRPSGRAYPKIHVDIRAEYFRPGTSADGSVYRSQFYRLEMDCEESTSRMTSLNTFTGNGLQGEVRISPPDTGPPASAIIPRSPFAMIESQACPMARGEPAPGFEPALTPEEKRAKAVVAEANAKLHQQALAKSFDRSGRIGRLSSEGHCPEARAVALEDPHDLHEDVLIALIDQFCPMSKAPLPTPH